MTVDVLGVHARRSERPDDSARLRNSMLWPVSPITAGSAEISPKDGASLKPCSDNTVKFHVSSLLKKAGARSRSELATLTQIH
jgi:hypothetical protein